MADLNTICSEIVNEVDDAFAAAVVDLNTGLLLSVSHNIPYFTQTYLDAVAAAAVDMFRGKNVGTVERLLSNQRGTEVRNSIQEVQMTTDKTYHFMTAIPGKENALLVLVTGKKANLGMGWMAVRSALPKVGEACP